MYGECSFFVSGDWHQICCSTWQRCVNSITQPVLQDPHKKERKRKKKCTKYQTAQAVSLSMLVSKDTSGSEIGDLWPEMVVETSLHLKQL